MKGINYKLKWPLSALDLKSLSEANREAHENPSRPHRHLNPAHRGFSCQGDRVERATSWHNKNRARGYKRSKGLTTDLKLYEDYITRTHVHTRDIPEWILHESKFGHLRTLETHIYIFNWKLVIIWGHASKLLRPFSKTHTNYPPRTLWRLLVSNRYAAGHVILKTVQNSHAKHFCAKNYQKQNTKNTFYLGIHNFIYLRLNVKPVFTTGTRLTEERKPPRTQSLTGKPTNKIKLNLTFYC